MHITLTELRYAVTVANEKHFSKAAAKNFVSQPTLSAAIKKLEDTLGVTIFERDKNKVLLTSTGLEVINRARQILEEVESLQKYAQNKKSIYSEPLKVGAIHTIGPYLFPSLITKIQQSNSPLNLIIEEGFTNDLIQKLYNGHLDAVIIAKPFSTQGLEHKDLYEETLNIILPKNHQLAKINTIQPQMLADYTILLLNNGNCFRDEVLKICPHCNLNNKGHTSRMITTTSIETIKYMVYNNVGISIIPQNSIRNADKSLITIKQFTYPEPKRHVILVYRPTFARKKILNELSSLISNSIPNS